MLCRWHLISPALYAPLAVECFTECIECNKEWIGRNHCKMQLIWIGTRQQLDLVTKVWKAPVEISGSVILKSDRLRNHYQHNERPIDHVANPCKKANLSCASSDRYGHHCHQASERAHALISSRLNYCNSLQHEQGLLKKLQCAQRCNQGAGCGSLTVSPLYFEISTDWDQM